MEILLLGFEGSDNGGGAHLQGEGKEPGLDFQMAFVKATGMTVGWSQLNDDFKLGRGRRGGGG